MTVFLISLVVMLSAVAGMSIGRLFGGRGIQGSCGSQAGVDGSGACDVCRRPCSRRRERGTQAVSGNGKTGDGDAEGRPWY